METWRNENKKKWKQQEIEDPKGSPKNKTGFFKHEVKKFHLLKCKKFFRTLQVTAWNIRKKVENHKFQKYIKIFTRAYDFKINKITRSFIIY